MLDPWLFYMIPRGFPARSINCPRVGTREYLRGHCCGVNQQKPYPAGGLYESARLVTSTLS